MRDRRGIVVGLAAVVLLASPATAREVLYPAARPAVRMIVPDDWSVAETPLGLELQSPQKDSLVLAATVAKDKKSLDDWSKRALDRMRAGGVVFAKDGPVSKGPAKPEPAKTQSSKTQSSKTQSSKTEPSEAGQATTGQATIGARGNAVADRWAAGSAGGDRFYTFNGIPSVDSPVAAAESKGVVALGRQAADQDLPTISSVDPRAATTSALHVTGHYAYRGGKLNGQPIDVELAVFPLDKQTRFLMEQASGPTDARGVAIVRSLKAVPAAAQ